MQPSQHSAIRTADHCLDRLNGVLDLTVMVRHGEQHKARKAEHRRRRSTVVVHLGPPSTRVQAPRILRPQGRSTRQRTPPCPPRTTTLDHEEPVNRRLRMRHSIVSIEFLLI